MRESFISLYCDVLLYQHYYKNSVIAILHGTSEITPSRTFYGIKKNGLINKKLGLFKFKGDISSQHIFWS